MNLVDINIPDIGASDNVRVAEIYVKEGDVIKENDNILMLETDKATMEIPANCGGVVKEITIQVGSKVKQGDSVIKVLIAQDDKSATSDSKQNNILIDETENIINCNVLVIGAGPGGYTAAFRAADLGLKVVLVEKHATLGGVCLNVGCIPSKALLHVAKVINDAKDMGNHGVSFKNVEIDVDKIRAYKSGIINKLTGGLDSLSKQRNINVINGFAKFISSNCVSVLVDGATKTIKFDNAIIATGSKSIKLPGIPYEDSRVIDSTGALELKDIPKNMLIIGGGIIGLEMAEVYSTLGSSITVVELGNNLIPGADRDLIKVLENRIKKRFKSIKTATTCTKFDPKKNGIYVTMRTGDTEEVDVFDRILVCVGRSPNGKDIDAQNAGVYVNERGFIPVNKECRTNVANIYAIGDVVGQPMLAHKATHEGKIAAENCAGLKAYFDAISIPSIAYTDPEVAWVGVTENDAKLNGLEIETGKFPWAASGRALSNGREDGFSKVVIDKNTKRIIGAGIVGVNAGELLAEAVLAIEMNSDIHDVSLTVHAHPTLSETFAFACEMVDGSITDLYVPKKNK